MARPGNPKVLFSCSPYHRDLHSFPTRRSSDLVARELDLLDRALDEPWELVADRDVLEGDLRVSHRRSEEHTSELQSHSELVCRLLLEKKNHHSGGPKWRGRRGGGQRPDPAVRG